MRTYLKTEQDATIYQGLPEFNTGLDEILEVGKLLEIVDRSSVLLESPIRFLVDFDINEETSYPPEAQYFLNFYIADAKNVNRYQKLEICPVTTEWIEGSGYRYQDVINAKDGASWEFASKDVEWQTPGGDFSTDTTSSYEFRDIPIIDVRIDVTDLIAPVIEGTNTTPWNGLIVKFPNADEQDQLNIGNIKFFSGNTHTIFEPRLEIVWDDQEFLTGSLKPIRDSNIRIVPRNLKQAYTRGEKKKIYLVVRDPYPDKRFDAVQRYKNTYYLPSGSFYRITDEVSGIKIHDFDQFSAISCDPTGSYIMLDTTGLDVERYYKLELKVTTDELVIFPEFNYSFKVENDG
jgi:hypothetical protein